MKETKASCSELVPLAVQLVEVTEHNLQGQVQPSLRPPEVRAGWSRDVTHAENTCPSAIVSASVRGNAACFPVKRFLSHVYQVKADDPSSYSSESM